MEHKSGKFASVPTNYITSLTDRPCCSALYFAGKQHGYAGLLVRAALTSLGQHQDFCVLQYEWIDDVMGACVAA